jgi:hypothetical protein
VAHRIEALLLHESPDLDAALGAWLLCRFGASKYPGVDSARLEFAPAGTLPPGLNADDLERQGVLAVDTGGGRLDNHGQPQITSSARLVATDLGLESDPALRKLLTFVHRADTEGRGVQSNDPIDRAISLPIVVSGLNIVFENHPERVVSSLFPIFDAIYAAEHSWLNALIDARTALEIVSPNGVCIIGITSSSTAAMRAARFVKKNDVVVHKAPDWISATITHHGRSDRSPFLLMCAALLRAAEELESGLDRVASSPELLRQRGLIGCWYLHDNYRIISNRSPRKPDVPASKIPWETTLQLIAAGLDDKYSLPDRYCDSRCNPVCRLGDDARGRCRWGDGALR